MIRRETDRDNLRYRLPEVTELSPCLAYVVREASRACGRAPRPHARARKGPGAEQALYVEEVGIPLKCPEIGGSTIRVAYSQHMPEGYALGLEIVGVGEVSLEKQACGFCALGTP